MKFFKMTIEIGLEETPEIDDSQIVGLADLIKDHSAVGYVWVNSLEKMPTLEVLEILAHGNTSTGTTTQPCDEVVKDSIPSNLQGS